MIEIIDLLKPKNGGSFKLLEAIDIDVEGYSSLADAVTHFATDVMIEAINVALSGKASQADLTALEAEVDTKADSSDLTTATANLQAQIDNIVTPVTQDAEVQNARVDTKGVSHVTLKARLDSSDNKVNNLWDYDYNNILNRGTIHNGYWTTSANASSSYKYISPVPVEAGKTYTVSPRARFVSLYNTSDQNVRLLDDGTATGIQSFTSEYDGYAYITLYTSEVATAKVYDSSTYDDVFPYNVCRISDSAEYNRLDTAETNILSNAAAIINNAHAISNVELNFSDYFNYNLIAHSEFIDGYIGEYGQIETSSSYKTTAEFISCSDTANYSTSLIRFIAWYSTPARTGFIRLDSFNRTQTSHYLTPPNGAKYFKITLYVQDYTAGGYYIHKGSNDLTDEAHADIVNTLGTVANLVYGLTTTSGYWKDGAHTDSDSYCYYSPIPIKASHTYTVYPRVRFVGLYNASGVYLNDADISGSSSAAEQSFTAEQDGFAIITVYAADYNNNLDKVFDTTTDTNEYPVDGRPVAETLIPNDTVRDYIANYIINQTDLIKGLKIYNFGDSIAVGGGNNNIGYAQLIASLYNATCNEYAVNGATMSKIAGQSMSCILTQIDNASEAAPDIILLEGGANDYTQYRVMGEVTGETVFDDAEFDVTTYIGALEAALYKLQTKYNGVPIIWIYTHRENTRTEKTDGTVTVNFTTMHDRSLEVCKKWAIPVVDLYNGGGLNTNWTAYRTAYTYNSDGTHPNEAGYKHFYIRPIVEKIKEVLPV